MSMTTNPQDTQKLPRIAAIQMCSSHIVDENLVMAAQLIEEAAANGANLVVLPEMFSIMGLNPNDKVTVSEIYGSGKVQSFLSEQAKRNKVWIVGGTIPVQCGDPNKVRAASIVYNQNGDLIARYDKIHLFDVTISETEAYRESDTTQPGNRIVVIDTPFGKLGLSVCYDLRFPELFRIMFNQGAEIICVPSAFTVKTGEAHWETLLKSRAIENFCYVIGAAQGAKHSSGRSTYGNSMIVEPWGTVTSKLAGTKPGVIYTDIDLAKLSEIRKSIPVADHQKIYFDTSRLEGGAAISPNSQIKL